jgi:nitrogen regulatory protein PII-like uncharacterized protein
MLSVKRLLAAIAVAVLLAGPVIAETTDMTSGASTYGMPDNEALRAQFEAFQAELQLSIEQQAIIAEILADYGARLEPLFRQGAETAWSIMNVAPRDPEYSLDTETAAQSAAETAAGIVRTISEMRSAIHSVMTEEQIATLDRLIEEKRAEMRAKIAEKKAAAESVE